MQKVTLLASKSAPDIHARLSHLPFLTRTTAGAVTPLLHALYTLLGGEGALPWAALLAHRYRLTPSMHWLVVEPIECQADLRTVYCVGAAHLQITPAEAMLLLDTLNQHLSAEGMHLYAPTPALWLLSMDKPLHIDTIPLSQVLGQDIAKCAPKHWPKDWQRLFVELEMLLHQHPVNQARQKAGQPKINACWFSGAGELKALPAQPNTAIVSDDPLIHTLGECVHAQMISSHLSYESVLAACESDINHVIIVPDTDDVRDLETQWLTALMAAVKAKVVQQVSINTADGQCYELSAGRKRIHLPFFS